MPIMAIRIRRPLLLRQWRKHRGLTQEKLAERLGTSKGYISQLESGKQRYNQQHLEALAEALDCDPVDLLIRDPTDPDGIWSIWDRVRPVDQDTARRILEQLAQPDEQRKKKQSLGRRNFLIDKSFVMANHLLTQGDADAPR